MNRLDLIASHILFFRRSQSPKKKQSITITDTRTGKKIQISTNNNFVKASDLAMVTFRKKILRSYDPGYMNTITCNSAISYIDGNQGILQFRGYPIEVLCKKASFLEVAFLLIYGELPPPKTYQHFLRKIKSTSFLHSDLGKMMKSFRFDAHPMGIMCSSLAALSTLYPQHNPSIQGDKVYQNRKIRNQCIYRILGKVPTIAANAYRHRVGRDYNMPHQSLPYVDNFFYMIDRLNEKQYIPNPVMTRALEILFIIYAEHQLNCSTAALRHLSSSGTDIYTAVAGAAGTLSGARHGRNSQLVLTMLQKIGTKKNIPQFIEDVKNKKVILYGFGHRIYKNVDPRVKIVKEVVEEVFSITGKEEIIELALELQNYALKEPYFQQRRLYPNVDYYCGIIYRALKFPKDMFPVLFMIPRMVGWLAHWNEFMQDKEKKLNRPRQNYTGYTSRKYVPIGQRTQTNFNLNCFMTDHSTRNRIANQVESDQN